MARSPKNAAVRILADLRAELERLVRLQLVHSENTEAKHDVLPRKLRQQLAALVRRRGSEANE